MAPMRTKKRKAQQPGHKVCNRCDQEMPATPEIFLRDASRPDGLAYECRACHSARKLGRDRRKERWAALTPDQKQARLARQRRYIAKGYGRAAGLLKRYRQIDECDLTAHELQAIIESPCVYCGTESANRGLDRIDNRLPHTKGNVQSACTECNLMRGDRFSVEEMRRIGEVVSAIRADRSAGPTQCAVRPSEIASRRPR
jgi:hypothetical protein